MSILATILAAKRAEIAQLDPADFPVAPGPARGFRAALLAAARPERGHLALIAEIKQRSPSRPLIRPAFDPGAMASAYARGGATALSVLTDSPFFGGALAHLALARQQADLPLLRKDFLLDPVQLAQARAYGADAVLLIAAALPGNALGDMLERADATGMDALVEVHTPGELDRALDAGATLIGVNNRDLTTFVVDLGTTERLAAHLRAHRRASEVALVSESGIATTADRRLLARCGASAMLVGEALLVQPDLAMAARRLLA